MRNTFSQPAAIVQRDTRRSQEVKKKLAALEKVTSNNVFDLGALLSEAHKGEYHRDWQFDSFGAWLKTTTFDVSERQAYYLIKIEDIAHDLNISRERLIAAGVSKLKVIFTLDPLTKSADIEKLVDEAPKLTVEEVKDKVQAADPDRPQSLFTWVNASMLREDRDQYFAPALQLCRLVSGTTIDTETGEEKELSDGACLKIICESYLQDPNNQAVNIGQSGDYEDDFFVSGLDVSKT